MNDLLNKWLGGTTTWDEEKKLRQAADQDDFLKEAIEGYDAFPNSNHMAATDRLKARLPKGRERKSGFLTSLPRIASAAAVVGLIGTLFWMQQKVENSGAISQHTPDANTSAPIDELDVPSKLSIETPVDEIIVATEQAPPIAKPTIKEPVKEKIILAPIKKRTTPPPPPPPPAISLEPEPTVLVEDNITVDLKEEEINVATESIIEEGSVIAMEMPEQVTEKEEALSSTTSEMTSDAVEYNAPAAVSATKSRQASPKMEAPLAKINTYAGQVQNEDGQPLNDVKIIGLNTPFSTISELNGGFLLETDIPLTKIAVSKDGFHTRKIAINQYSDFLNVSLNRKTTINPDIAEQEIIAPKPVNGFVDFFEYIEKNKIYPKGTTQNEVERDVEVRFYIDKNGTPTNLKVSNPGIHGFDEEAIRLIKNGPKWQPINSYARYYVPF